MCPHAYAVEDDDRPVSYTIALIVCNYVIPFLLVCRATVGRDAVLTEICSEMRMVDARIVDSPGEPRSNLHLLYLIMYIGTYLRPCCWLSALVALPRDSRALLP